VTGTAGAVTRTASATLTVTPPPPPADYSLSVSPTSRTVRQGRTGNFTVTITRTGDFAGSVALTTVGMPAGWTATFTPASTTGISSALAVKTLRSTLTGTYTFTIQGTSGSLVRTTTATVILAPK